MSLDSRAITLVGVILDADQLYTEKSRETCDSCRTKVRKNARFCHNCGDRLDPVQRQPVADYDENEETLAGLCAIRPALFGPRVAVGVILADANASNEQVSRYEFADFSFDQCRLKVQEALTPLALWDEKQFGYWTVLVFRD